MIYIKYARKNMELYMIDYNNFKIWITKNHKYSNRTISNIMSRLKRANSLLQWSDNKYYLFDLENLNSYKKLSSSIRSQLRQAIKLYSEYIKSIQSYKESAPKGSLNALSLFANIGVAEEIIQYRIFGICFC